MPTVDDIKSPSQPTAAHGAMKRKRPSDEKQKGDKEMKLPDHVYHLAEAANWTSIQRHGLLSASKLLDEAGLVPIDHNQLERAQRLEHTKLPSGVHIRDQRPLPPAALASCLVGLTPAQWYAQINIFLARPESAQPATASRGHKLSSSWIPHDSWPRTVPAWPSRPLTRAMPDDNRRVAAWPPLCHITSGWSQGGPVRRQPWAPRNGNGLNCPWS
jgi:hypothetical protein